MVLLDYRDIFSGGGSLWSNLRALAGVFGVALYLITGFVLSLLGPSLLEYGVDNPGSHLPLTKHLTEFGVNATR